VSGRLSRAARTLRTLAHVPPTRIAHRALALARAPLFETAAYRRLLAAAPPAAVVRPAPWGGGGDADAGRRILEGRFAFLGEPEARLPGDGWRPAGRSHLWLFHLHYFDWLDDLLALPGEEAARAARAHVGDWIAAHPWPDRLAWHPYPLSTRIHAWLRHSGRLLGGAPDSLREAFSVSLGRQAAHLRRTPELDVRGNHIVRNLKALVAAGTCVEGARALADGALGPLRRELDEQVLPDGMHFERSPSYHAQVLADLADTADALRAAGAAPDWLEEAVARMAAALRFLRRPDGLLPLFNDGEVGTAAGLDRLEARLPPGPAAAALPDAGYFGLGRRDGLLAILDAGLCGPDWLLAHAHADALSFEMSAGGEPLVVNSGTFGYQVGETRSRLRGTAAHSTLALDGADSAEVYGTFRVGRRPRRVAARPSPGRIEADHDGWRHLGLAHRRTLASADGGRRLEGRDALEGPGAARRPDAAARFHLHPSAAVEPAAGGALLRTAGGRTVRFACDRPVRIEAGVYSPRFGELLASACLVADMPAGAGDAVGWSFALDP